MNKNDKIMDIFMQKIRYMQFLSPDDLFIRKAYIREQYRQLSTNEREIYKWYFYYQLMFIKNPLKRAFWDYMNNDNDIKFVDLNLNTEYREFCNKRSKIIEKEQEMIQISIEF